MSEYNAPDAFLERTRKARKDHQCCECAAQILAGSEYVYSSGVWDHSPNSYKTCKRCAEVRNMAYRRTDHGEDGPVFGQLAAWICEEEEYWNDESRYSGLRLRSEIIDKAREIWSQS